MFTLENYRAEMERIKSFEERSRGLDYIRKGLAKNEKGRYSWGIGNISEKCLSAFAIHILNKEKLPSDLKIYTKSNFSHWTIRQGKAFKESTVACKLHQLVGFQVSHQSINEAAFQKWNRQYPRLDILSENIPVVWYTNRYTGYNILRYFNGLILNSIPFIEDLMSTEWRFEYIHFYEEDSINFILKQLSEKGFILEIQPPYIVIHKGHNRKTLSVSSHQSVSLRIEKEACFWSQEGFSAQNVFNKWCSVKKKHSLSGFLLADSITSLENILTQISSELEFASNADSLVKRYAFDVHTLSESKQQELLEKLAIQGYKACIDSKFIYLETGNDLSYRIKQYVLIDLP